MDRQTEGVQHFMQPSRDGRTIKGYKTVAHVECRRLVCAALM